MSKPGASNSIARGPHVILNTKLKLRVISSKYKLLNILFRINTLQPHVIACTNSYKHVLKCSSAF